MNQVQMIAIVAALLFLAQVLYLTSKNRLHDQQAFMWILFALGALIVGIALPWFNGLANVLGVSYMPTLIFMTAFFIILSLLIYYTIVISKQDEKMKSLVQELAFLSKEVEDLRRDLSQGE
ncbi:DUF2304 domain-containing protein [Fredinandcohnia quinoae]|uniref:DUF2304 domain-containing protein n=1 Tax=Fredinandcohnia quinoae TaxID=2918902 RepID=A0AAW5E7I2_9BACI|nr:DUF2304 domain-containing protein [Fredinandcohnia sp. SECRCQ15]MCH1625098.1 DUF2304 domain-containing protein [Fredinandcohnia sp. SECRCQ15]